MQFKHEWITVYISVWIHIYTDRGINSWLAWTISNVIFLLMMKMVCLTAVDVKNPYRFYCVSLFIIAISMSIYNLYMGVDKEPTYLSFLDWTIYICVIMKIIQIIIKIMENHFTLMIPTLVYNNVEFFKLLLKILFFF